MKSDREYRDLKLEIEERSENGEPSYIVRGYASTFEPYVLFEDEGIQYKEKIDPHAFDECDMSDVVFRIDHEGAVYARSSAGTLKISVDEHGLMDEADLSKTPNARNLFEDIKAGNYPKQSFAFSVREDSYDKETHTRTITKIKKLFDVSPVSFPANPGTELDIATRDYFNGVIEMEKAERLENEKRERARKALELKIKILERTK
jgi:HK97 family phage prohead protease